MKQIELLKTIFKDSPDILEPLNEIEKEIERLNNIINEYKVNTIPTLEHNIDVLVDSEDRLNNIINELEKDFERKIQSCTIDEETTTNDFYCKLHIAILTKWLNKIKELKENK